MIAIALLHDGMLDKHGKIVTTSLTTIDVHDIARSARTFGVGRFYVCHSSAILRSLARTLAAHWHSGFGATYNPNRKEALDLMHISESLDHAISDYTQCFGSVPKLVATSARRRQNCLTFNDLAEQICAPQAHHIIFLGSGWGMGPDLLSRMDLVLEPIEGAGSYNHLSVRAAAAIILDRLLGR